MPLHRRMTWANAPLVTLTLVLLNCLVYLCLQSGDDGVLRRAQDYYSQSHLGQTEFPAYQSWLRDHPDTPDGAERLKAMQTGQTDLKIAVIQSDHAFITALHDDRVIAPSNPDYTEWHAKRAEFEGIYDSTFTSRHALRFSHVEPGRMFWAMFMHGGLEHLLGNMLLLLMLGLLVE